MIVPVMAISNLVLTRQIYSEETNGAHVHNRDRIPVKMSSNIIKNESPYGDSTQLFCESTILL